MRPTIGFQKKQRRHAQAPTQHAIVSLTHRSFDLLYLCVSHAKLQEGVEDACLEVLWVIQSMFFGRTMLYNSVSFTVLCLLFGRSGTVLFVLAE